MKKFIVIVSTSILMLLGLFCISSSAARYTNLPITMNQTYNGVDSMFTLYSFDVQVHSNTDPIYTNTADIHLSGQFNQGSSMAIAFYCYDPSGNHIKTVTWSIDNSATYFDISIIVPDVTASIEIGPCYPGSWTNTYYYCKYTNVYSADGRTLGIPELLVPVYKNCGWYHTITMYALDGRSLEVPYGSIAAYQNVGWYLYNDFTFQVFKANYNAYLSAGQYSDAFFELEEAIYELANTNYAQQLYSYKTSLMDAWRQKISSPLAYCSSYTRNGRLDLSLRNISYKTIKTFTIEFDCYDAYNNKLAQTYDYYIIENVEHPSSQTWNYFWESIPWSTKYIGNFRVTSVTFTDGSTWTNK